MTRAAAQRRLFSSLAGYRRSWLAGDLRAALTLAAVAIPEQMATARLVGLPPPTGLVAFAAGTLVFALLGRSRLLSVGADSTIAPIIGGALAGIAVTGATTLAGLASLLGTMVGLVLILTRVFRLGWIADLLSIPVATGFLLGIAGHILVGQMPAVLGLPVPPGALPERLLFLAAHVIDAYPAPLVVAGATLGISLLAERVDRRLPGPLIGLVCSALAVWWLGLETRGVALVGAVSLADLHPSFTLPAWTEVTGLVPVALIVALLVMMQTATVIQSLGEDGKPRLEDEFAAIGAGCIAAGLAGAFPVNASPPRTAITRSAGGHSQLAGLLAVVAAAAVLVFGTGLLARIPLAALGGILIFIALRLVRGDLIGRIFRASRAEGATALGCAAMVILLPIEIGVGLGIVLSILASLYAIARPKCPELTRIPGTTIWWADSPRRRGERLPGVLVFALGAPVNFMNIRHMLDQLDAALAARGGCRLLVLEANGVAAIDFTGADLLIRRIADLRRNGLEVALARLESVTASAAAERTGLIDALGTDHVFESVNDAVAALRPRAAAAPAYSAALCSPGSGDASGS